MKISRTDQVVLGLWLSLAIGIGITSRSWNVTLGVLLVGIFIMAPTFLKMGLNAPSKVVQRLSSALIVVWFLIIGAFVMSGVERMYWVNASFYPQWLSSGQLAKDVDIEQLRQGACKELGPIEIAEKQDGLYFLRCGVMWHSSKIFYTSTNPMSQNEVKK
jgi:hypothetical protein